MTCRLVTVAALLAASILATPTAAHADTCGDTATQWVPTLGSTWTGTAGADDLTLAAVQVENAAVTVHGVLPLVGPWTLDTETPSFVWTGATTGYSYFYQVYPVTCSGGKVTYAEGSGHDAVFNSFGVTLTRVT